jgi:hypothetical protein
MWSLLLLSFALSWPVAAADAAGKYALRGAGLTRCKSFLDAYEKKGPQAHLFFGWIDGYISGLNELSADTYDKTPWQSTELLAEVVRRACKRSPAEYFFSELRSVVAAMDEQRLATGEEKKVLEIGEGRAVVYPDTLRRAQVALKKLGHYGGDTHGRFDPATHAAIVSFQTAKVIPVTGLPGPITLWALLIEQ